MLPKRLHLIFGNDSVCEIELLQTDLVKIWYNAFSKNKNFKLFTRNHNPTLHSNVVRNSYPEAIDIINNAIERVEYLTNTEWNVRAFDGMQFDITNKIHRMFTTSDVTNCRTYELSQDLKNFIIDRKQNSYISHSEASGIIELWSQSNQQYAYNTTDRNELNHNLQLINSWIHLYESESMYSGRTRHISQISNTLVCDFEVKRIDGSYINGTPTEFTISTPQIPQCHYNDSANVYALKKILGKDYLTCYYDIDNPLEWDVTMAHIIDGSFYIDYEGIYEHTYNTDNFKYWVSDFKLKDKHTYANIQIGTVVNNWCSEIKNYAHQRIDKIPNSTRNNPLIVEKESQLNPIEPDWACTEIIEIF